MTRFTKAQIGILLASLTLALASTQAPFTWWPFQKAQIAEVGTPDYTPTVLHFAPSEITFSRVGSEHSQTVDLLVAVPDESIDPQGFTISFDYNQDFLEFTQVENLGPFTQQLGTINYGASPLTFSFVRPPSVLGEKTVAQLGQDTTMCTMDVYTCPDGTQVGRTAPGCTFICPGDSDYIPRSPKPIESRLPTPTPTPMPTPTYTPSPSSYPSPSHIPMPVTHQSIALVRLTFFAKQIPEGGASLALNFVETSVVVKDREGSIIDIAEPLIVRLTEVPDPTADPSLSISCQPIVYKVPGSDYLVSASDRVATDSNTIKAHVGDSYAYGVQVTNISQQHVSTSGIPLKFTAASTNPYQDFQKIYGHLNNCVLGNNQISCDTDHLNLPVGQSIILPAGEPNSPFFVTGISDTTQANATSTFEFSFGRGLSCGMIHVETAMLKTGDLNKDGRVDIFDYQTLIVNFGNPYTIFDYQKIIANYGK